MSMNVSFFLNFAFHSCRSDCPGKRLQKYNFFLIPQAFFKKNSFIFFPFEVLNKHACLVFQFYNEHHSSRFGWAKIQSFSFILQIFFKLFFHLLKVMNLSRPFLFPLYSFTWCAPVLKVFAFSVCVRTCLLMRVQK